MGDLKQWFLDGLLNWHYWAYIIAAGLLLGLASAVLDEFRWRRQRRELERRDQQRRKHDERREREWRSRIEQQWRDDHQQRSSARNRDDPDGPQLDPRGPKPGRRFG